MGNIVASAVDENRRYYVRPPDSMRRAALRGEFAILDKNGAGSRSRSPGEKHLKSGSHLAKGSLKAYDLSLRLFTDFVRAGDLLSPVEESMVKKFINGLGLAYGL